MTPSSRSVASRRRTPLPDAQDMERRLRAAVRADAIDIHYQPLVDLLANRPVAVEALARWDDPVLGSVPPTSFIAVAESSDLIQELGRQVLQRAASTVASWPGLALMLDVNVSPRQLQEGGFVAVVADVLEQSGIAPEQLCLEITETAAVEDLGLTSRLLAQVRALGVQIALDDFGTGYSSLTVLRELPVDIVKMDRAFVAHLTTDSRAAVLARLVIDAAHSMGMRVCAEGVETRAQAGQLVGLGCDLAQGWMYAPAMPADDERMTAVRAGEPLASRIDVDEFRHPLAGADELVLVTDLAGTLDFVSAASLGLLGLSPAELVGTSITEHLEPVGTTWEVLGGVLPDGTHRVVTKVGANGRRWLDVTIRRSQETDSHAHRLVGVARDMTAVVRAEEQLAESEDRFRRAFDEAPIGMAMTTLDGVFLRVNEAFAALLGWEPADIMDRTVADLTVSEDRAADDANLQELHDGAAQVHDVRKRYRHRLGHAVPVRVRAALVAGKDEHPPYVLAHVLPAAEPPPV